MIDSKDQIKFISDIFQLQRDIISPGYDEAISILEQRFGLMISEYPTGAKCLDWTVPPGWICEEAFVEDEAGVRVIDKSRKPLSVASYSTPIDQVISRETLLDNVVVNRLLPDEPPFLFYYYSPQWKFGSGYELPDKLKPGNYRAVIRSNFYQGQLKVGEIYLPGESDKEFILSTHLCHPHQVNDGLSGVATGLALMEWLSGFEKRKWSYRMIIGPETIGSVCWLSQNLNKIPNIIGGMFLEMTGLQQRPALQRSYEGQSFVDQVFEESFRNYDQSGWVAKYRGIVGNDERQFNGPGFRIPMLSYSRAHPWGHPHRPYREYHSANDDLSITSPEALHQSFEHIKFMIEALEAEKSPVGNYKGEAFLSGLGLALDRNQHLDVMRNRMKILDMLDGSNSISHISKALQLPIQPVREFVNALDDAGAIVEEEDSQLIKN